MTLSSYQRILIRVPNWLGDTMMATPAVAALKEMFPKAKIAVAAKASSADFWRGFPGVSEVVEVRKGLGVFLKTAAHIKKGSYDAVLLLPNSLSSALLASWAGVPERIGWAGEGRSFLLTKVIARDNSRKRHLVWEYLDLVREGMGKALPKKEPRLQGPLSSNAKGQAAALLKKEGVQVSKGLIAMGPGATYGPAKRWPLTYWQELVGKILKKRKEDILILGGPEEVEYLKPLLESLAPLDKKRVHSLAGKTPLPVLAAVLSLCKNLITNDTGPMHVAAAVGTPVTAIFGSTSPAWTAPFGKGHEVLYKHVECSPCFQKTCPIGYICLNQITVEEVYRAAERQLGTSHR